MMNYMAEGLISFLSAHGTLGDEPDWCAAESWRGVVYLDGEYLAGEQCGTERWVVSKQRRSQEDVILRKLLHHKMLTQQVHFSFLK